MLRGFDFALVREYMSSHRASELRSTQETGTGMRRLEGKVSSRRPATSSVEMASKSVSSSSVTSGGGGGGGGHKHASESAAAEGGGGDDVNKDRIMRRTGVYKNKMASAQTKGLRGAAVSLKLQDKIADADAWCIAQGADEIADLDGEEDLAGVIADALRIKIQLNYRQLKVAAGTTPVGVTDTPRPAQVPLPDGCEFSAFLTHSWVKGEADTANAAQQRRQD